MPRYSMVAPTFNPVDYKTRIQPLEQYKEEYDKRMDALDEQDILASTIGGLIDEHQDPELARVYKDYNDKMVNTANELLRTGDLGSSRRALRELRSDYANKLVPIQQAFNSRAEAAKSFRDAKIKDPSLLGNDPVNTNLGSWMNGKAPNVKTISGNQLYAYGQANAKAASGRQFRETAWRLDKNLGNQFFSRIKADGWSQDEVVQALAGYANSGDKQISKDAKALLDYMVQARDTIHSMTGVDELGDSNMIKAADRYIIDGFIDGISYKEEDKQQAYNPYKFETAKYNMEEAKWRAKKAQADYDGTKNKPKTDKSFVSGSDKYTPTGNIKLVDKALNPFGSPIHYNGIQINDAIDAYEQLHANDSKRKSLEERIKNISDKYDVQRYADGYIVREKVEERNRNNLPVQRWRQNDNLTLEINQLQNELNNIERDDYNRGLMLKPFALSDKEYKDITKIVGDNGKDFSKEKLLQVVANNIDYTAEAQMFNRQEIAGDEPFTQKLKDVICHSIRKELKSNNGANVIYETEDGYSQSGKAKSLKPDDFDSDKVESIEMSPFSVANGMVIVKMNEKGGGKTYLVPAYLLGNEGGSNIITAGLMNPDDDTELWNSSLAGAVKSAIYGAHSDSVRDRLELADDKIHDAISAIQRNFLQNHPQAWSTSVVKGQGELPTYIDDEE